MKILGVDPGLEATGIALVEFNASKLEIKFGDTIYTDFKASLPEKLAFIYNYIKNITSFYFPDWIVVEDVFTKRYPFSATKIAQVQAVVFLIAGLLNIPVKTYHPTEIKKAIAGNGRANKEEVAKAVSTLFSIKNEKLSEHVIDALALIYYFIIELEKTGIFNVV